MRETQCEPVVKVGEAQEAGDLYQSPQSFPIVNDLDLDWVHMHPMFIHDVY
jgi:hypothetical protein